MPALDRLIQRVRRRLYVQMLLASMLPFLAGALTAVAIWFVLQPLLWSTATAEWKWGAAGALLGIGVIGAAVRAQRRAPTLVTAALAVDDRFALKERVTTLLTLSPEQMESPAGQALSADVNQRIASLELAGQFPLRISWTGAMLPVCAALLAVSAYFFKPFWTAEAGPANTIPAAAAKEIKSQLDTLKKLSLSKLDELPK